MSDKNQTKKDDLAGWLPFEEKQKPKKSDTLKTKIKNETNKKKGNDYALVFQVLFGHASLYKHALDLYTEQKVTTNETQKGLIISDILKRIQEIRGLKYQPDSQPIYDVLNRMRNRSIPYVGEYEHTIGKNKEAPHYYLTDEGFAAYSSYGELKKSNLVRDLIEGIEDY